jgi:hypothetical protein
MKKTNALNCWNNNNGFRYCLCEDKKQRVKGDKKMTQKQVLKAVNLIIAIDFLIILLTALFNIQIYSTGLYFYFHAIPGIILAALVGLHLFLNRAWIKNTYFKKKS